MSQPRGFSLVEVVIAVGVFAVAVVAILGLLPSLAREAAEAAEYEAAQRLSDALRLELQKRVRTSGLDAVAANIPPMSGRLEAGARFVAAYDGAAVRALDSSTGGAGDFFLVEVWRFDLEPLAHASGDAVLSVYGRVAWPYWPRGAATPVPPGERNHFAFTLALNP